MKWLRLCLASFGILAAHAVMAASSVRCAVQSPLPACQYQQAGEASCQDLRPAQRQACMQQFTPPTLCQRERDKRSCEQLALAQQSCTQLAGAARRQCVAAQLPAPACPAGSTPAHCQARQAAWQQCAPLFGSDRRQCLHREMQKRQDDGSALR
jgi:hypothetical protein